MEYEAWLNPSQFSGKVALDIGANCGSWVFQLLERFERVVAVEPQPVPAAKLWTQLVEQNLQSRVDLVVGAVAGSDPASAIKPIFVYDNDEISGANGARSESPRRGKMWAAGICLTDLLMFFRPDFVKLDVEGAEEEIIGRGIISIGMPVWCVEIHNRQAGAVCCEKFIGEDYDVEIVRNPLHPQGSQHYDEHYWLIARPRKET